MAETGKCDSQTGKTVADDAQMTWKDTQGHILQSPHQSVSLMADAVSSYFVSASPGPSPVSTQYMNNTSL